MFTKEQRGGFKYTIAHVLAYNLTALNLGVWKFKYIFHDWEKPWLMLLARITGMSDPYKWVQNWHRHHRKHHLEYYQPASLSHKRRNIDPVAMIIDWECSRLTKTAAQYTAYEHFCQISDKLTMTVRDELETTLRRLGLWPK